MSYGSVPAYERDAKEAEEQLIAGLESEKFHEPNGDLFDENEAAVWGHHGPVCVLPMKQRVSLQAIRSADLARCDQMADPVRLPERPAITSRRRAA